MAYTQLQSANERTFPLACTVCKLKKASLLDTAHITPDSDKHGLAVTPTRLSLCKIHHAACRREDPPDLPQYGTTLPLAV